jgi:FkbM family methyltransferase
MNLLKRITNKLKYLYRRNVLRDPFLLEITRWFRDKGDETLRLEYPLTIDSIVFDLGGYHGDFAEAVSTRYGCKVYIFEPVPEFYQKCVQRFQHNSKIICFNYGLSSANGSLNIGLAENSSSFASPHAQGPTLQVRVRSIVECIRELGLTRIHLMKINIEGGEFDVLPAIIMSDDIEKVEHLQIQFHNFVDNSEERRNTIRASLGNTHTEMWNYEFVWESWKLKEVER